MYLRALDRESKTDDQVLRAAGSGRIDRAILVAKQPELDRAAKEGIVWTVLHEGLQSIPGLPEFVQRALNFQCVESVSEVECIRLLRKYTAAAQWKSAVGGGRSES